MAEDQIRYDILTQDALRGVVRKVLAETARAGLPGEHHFYVSFETTAPGVRISSRLLNDYPEEMTIVIQHQFWDLKVTDHAFEIGLSFGSVPEKLFVPFAALKGFADPSVQFALQFEKMAPPTSADNEDDAEGTVMPISSDDSTVEPDNQPGEGESGSDAADGETSETDENPREADVVSLDAFRKK